MNIEDATFEEFEKDPESFDGLEGSHWTRNGTWIEDEMNRNRYEWCVVIGNTLHAGSDTMSEYPTDDELLAIAKQTNRVPVAYAKPGVIEETISYRQAA